MDSEHSPRTQELLSAFQEHEIDPSEEARPRPR